MELHNTWILFRVQDSFGRGTELHSRRLSTRCCGFGCDVQDFNEDPTKAQDMPSELSLPAMISSRMAKLFWPGEDAVGKTFRTNGLIRQQVAIIGVVGDVKARKIREAISPEVYFPLDTILIPKGESARLTIAINASGPLNSTLSQVRATVRSLDSSLSMFHIRTMDDVVAESMQGTSLQTILLGTFAALALILVSVGIYGVTAYLVTQRTKEMGIRLALGARRTDVLSLILIRGAKLTVTGVIIGLILALFLTRLMSSVLFGVQPTDVATYLEVAMILAGIALLACYIPARRATKVDPMVALRFE